jgi:biopolymer transport protein ExbB/TolQ
VVIKKKYLGLLAMIPAGVVVTIGLVKIIPIVWPIIVAFFIGWLAIAGYSLYSREVRREKKELAEAKLKARDLEFDQKLKEQEAIRDANHLRHMKMYQDALVTTVELQQALRAADDRQKGQD